MYLCTCVLVGDGDDEDDGIVQSLKQFSYKSIVVSF